MTTKEASSWGRRIGAQRHRRLAGGLLGLALAALSCTGAASAASRDRAYDATVVGQKNSYLELDMVSRRRFFISVHSVKTHCDGFLTKTYDGSGNTETTNISDESDLGTGPGDFPMGRVSGQRLTLNVRDSRHVATSTVTLHGRIAGSRISGDLEMTTTREITTPFSHLYLSCDTGRVSFTGRLRRTGRRSSGTPVT